VEEGSFLLNGFSNGGGPSMCSGLSFPFNLLSSFLHVFPMVEAEAILDNNG
jgi:hypothetical protein